MAVLVLAAQIKDLTRYPAIPLAALSLDFAFTAPTAFADGIQIPVTGREVILIQNTDAGAQTITIASTRDEYGRLGDITTYSFGAGFFGALPVGSLKLFGSSTGFITITMSANTVKVAVLRAVNQL